MACEAALDARGQRGGRLLVVGAEDEVAVWQVVLAVGISVGLVGGCPGGGGEGVVADCESTVVGLGGGDAGLELVGEGGGLRFWPVSVLLYGGLGREAVHVVFEGR